MSWRLYQRIFELTSVGVMIAGIVLLFKRNDPQHQVIYVGFILLATGKLIEALHVHDPNFKIFKATACVCIYALALLSLFYNIRSIIYISIPLGIYYILHYRLIFQQRKI